MTYKFLNTIIDDLVRGVRLSIGGLGLSSAVQAVHLAC